MPEYLITSPFKWDGEIQRQGTITLTEEEAKPLISSGSLAPLLNGLELEDNNQLFTLDMSTMDITPVSASELQGLVIDPAMPGADALKQVFVVAEGRAVEVKGKSYTERQFILLTGDEAAPLVASGDAVTIEQLAETMRQAELAELIRLADEEANALALKKAQEEADALALKKAQEEAAALAAKKAQEEAAALAAKKAQEEAAALAAKKAQEKAAAKKAATAKD